MNIITIDPSISCTAMVINDKKFIFTNTSYANTKRGLNKWFTKCKDYMEYIIFADIEHSPDYSLLEMIKLKYFESIALSIFNKILEVYDPLQDTKIYIEGYSYSSLSGPIIDLVTLSTLIRRQCLKVTPSLTVIAPKSLKIATCKFVYPEIKVKKKIEFRNHEGVSGGKFTKTEMCKAIIDSNLTCEWSKFLRDNKDEILTNKSIPKPIEDINDAKLMFEIFKS